MPHQIAGKRGLPPLKGRFEDGQQALPAFMDAAGNTSDADSCSRAAVSGKSKLWNRGAVLDRYCVLPAAGDQRQVDRDHAGEAWFDVRSCQVQL